MATTCLVCTCRFWVQLSSFTISSISHLSTLCVRQGQLLTNPVAVFREEGEIFFSIPGRAGFPINHHPSWSPEKKAAFTKKCTVLSLLDLLGTLLGLAAPVTVTQKNEKITRPTEIIQRSCCGLGCVFAHGNREFCLGSKKLAPEKDEDEALQAQNDIKRGAGGHAFADFFYPWLCLESAGYLKSPKGQMKENCGFRGLLYFLWSQTHICFHMFSYVFQLPSTPNGV